MSSHRRKAEEVRSNGPPTANGSATPVNGPNGDEGKKTPVVVRRIDVGGGRQALVAFWKEWEVPRKVLHSSIGFGVIYGYVSHTSVPTLIKYLSSALAVIVTADIIRLNVPPFARFYERVLGAFMRESEKSKPNGVIWYLVGVMTVLSVLPRDLAALSIIHLSWVDTSASILGKLFGRYTPKLPSPFPPRKSVAGFLGGTLAGTLSSYLFWSRIARLGSENDSSWIYALPSSPLEPNYYYSPPPNPVNFVPKLPAPGSTLGLWGLSLLGGVVAGLAELTEVWGLDDNLTLPVLSGLGMWFTMWLFG